MSTAVTSSVAKRRDLADVILVPQPLHGLRIHTRAGGEDLAQLFEVTLVIGRRVALEQHARGGVGGIPERVRAAARNEHAAARSGAGDPIALGRLPVLPAVLRAFDRLERADIEFSLQD